MWFSVVLGSKPWLCEYDLVPLPWRISTSPPWSGSDGRIRLGVMWHDGVVLPQPPIRRALKMLVDALSKSAAFEIVEYEPFKHLQASELAVSMRTSNISAWLDNRCTARALFRRWGSAYTRESSCDWRTDPSIDRMGDHTTDGEGSYNGRALGRTYPSSPPSPAFAKSMINVMLS
jgi:hypothetical protein